MLNKKEKLYTLDDVTIIPAPLSDIEHRKEINCYYNYNSKQYLPIFTAPMASIVNEENLQVWHDNHVIPIIPRNITFDKRLDYMLKGEWVALGLEEFEKLFCGQFIYDNVTIKDRQILNLRVLIDVANGHMKKIQDLIERAREVEKATLRYQLEIMIGNIANPAFLTRINLDNVDYIRLSIGTGSCCLTSSYTGVHYPMASLITDCANTLFEMKIKYPRIKKLPKLIADGGMRSYDDIIKALALGADYVMLGSVLSAVLESASPLYKFENNDYMLAETLDNVTRSYCKIDKYNAIVELHTTLIDEFIDKFDFKDYPTTLYKRNYGMSTPEAQLLINPNAKQLKHTEGKERYLLCKFTLKEWADELTACLRSMLSYVNILDIKDIKLTECRIMSDKAKKRINEI